MTTPHTMILHGGGMNGLVALASRAAERPALLFVHDGRPSESHRLAACQLQAQQYETRGLHELSLPHLYVQDATGVHRRPLAAFQMLSAAVGEAVKLGVERLIWPVRVGEQFDRMSSVMEAMVLLEHVAEMETGRRIRVETPLLELTARQLIETGHHMAVPWRLARSCELPMEDPCGQCAGCTARKVAFEEAALDDPLMQTA